MSPKISVIVPFYKTPISLLRKCIERLINQSFSDFELILVDDGNDQEIYSAFKQEYTLKDYRIKFIYQKNAGVSAARNTGLQAATGEYIVFHDADDFAENNFLYSLYSEIIKNVDLVICGIAEQWYPTCDEKLDARIFLSLPSYYNYVQYTNFVHNKLFKKDIIQKNQLLFNPNIKLGEDALFVAQYIKYCQWIRILPQNLYHYVPHAFSTMRKYDPDLWLYEKQVINTWFHLFTHYPLNDNEVMFLQHWYYLKLRWIFSYYLHGEKTTQAISIIKTIMDDSKFKEITSRSNVYFSKKDRVIVGLWRRLGAHGVKLSYDIKLFIDKLTNCSHLLRKHL